MIDPNTEPTCGRTGLLKCCATLAMAAGALLLVPGAVRAQAPTPTFNTEITTSTNSSFNFPGFAAVGDFNGDGKLDALVTDGSSNLRFMMGNGNGTFTEHDIAVAGANPGPIQAADLNGDGRLDAVFVSNGGNQQATVLLNTGNDSNGVPQFAVTTYAPGFGQLRSVTVGDLNGDGHPDFIVGGAYAQLRVYLNNGDGTFREGVFTTIQPSNGGPAVGPGAIVDLNGDGKADYVVASIQAHATDIFFGNGDGTLQNPVVLPGAPLSLAVGDLNKDGVPDFAEGTIDGNVAVYLNHGDGTFGTPALYATGGLHAPYAVSSLALTDMNGDGNLDAVAGNFYNYYSNYNGTTVAVLVGHGDGTFGAANLYTVNAGPLAVSTGDFNSDGKHDIAVVSYPTRTYDVLLNTTVTVPPLVFKSLTASPAILWAPNHKLVPITLTPTFTGGLKPVSWHVVSVTSNEPANGVGDGNTSSDWVIEGQNVEVRAERAGNGGDRVYTITVEGDDSSSPAQKVTDTVTVTVPHDQRADH